MVFSILHVSTYKDEIFILEEDRSLIRIAFRPENFAGKLKHWLEHCALGFLISEKAALYKVLEFFTSFMITI